MPDNEIIEKALRTAAQLPLENSWQSTPPTYGGQWWMVCGETNGEPELVRVEWSRGELWVMDCPIGSLPLRFYHDGLTDCQWQVASNA